MDKNRVPWNFTLKPIHGSVEFSGPPAMINPFSTDRPIDSGCSPVLMRFNLIKQPPKHGTS